MIVSVQTICDNAVDLADVKNSAFIDQSGLSGSEMLRYANLGYQDVYQQIKLAKEHYYITTYQFVTNGQMFYQYPLPEDFYELNGVDLIYLQDNTILTLTAETFLNRNKYSFYFPQFPIRGTSLHYVLYDTTIELLPTPPAGYTVNLWYTPNPVEITSVTQNLTLPVGASEYVSLYMACLMKTKAEEDVTALYTKLLQVKEQLLNSLRDRDVGMAAKTTDIHRINNSWWGNYLGYPYGGVY